MRNSNMHPAQAISTSTELQTVYIPLNDQMVLRLFTDDPRIARCSH